MIKMHHYRGVFVALLLNFVLLLTFASNVVFAHAKVDSATPGIGGVVSTAPTSVSVHTVENMKPGAQFSNLFVYGPSGELISQGDAKIALSTPDKMSVDIKPEKDGIYIVRWITVSANDNDPDQGAFTFTVKSGATSSTTSGATSSSTPARSPEAPTTTASNTGSPVLPALVTGIIALLLGIAGGFALGRNRGTSSTPRPTIESTKAVDNDKVVH